MRSSSAARAGSGKKSVFDSFVKKDGAEEYLARRKFGAGGNKDDSDPDENDGDEIPGATPNTQRHHREEKKKHNVQKLSPCKTYISLMKGFVACAILTLPKSFVNGGWAF